MEIDKYDKFISVLNGINRNIDVLIDEERKNREILSEIGKSVHSADLELNDLHYTCMDDISENVIRILGLMVKLSGGSDQSKAEDENDSKDRTGV